MNKENKDDLVNLKANLHLVLVTNSSPEAPRMNNTNSETDESDADTTSCQNGVCILTWRPQRRAS